MKSNILILLLVFALLLCGCHKKNSQPIPASEPNAAATISEGKGISGQENAKTETVEESIPVKETDIIELIDASVPEQVPTMPAIETQESEIPELIETTPETEPTFETESVPDIMSDQFDPSCLNGRWEYRLHHDGMNYIAYIIFGDDQTISTGIGIEYGEIYDAFDGYYSIEESISETDAILYVEVEGGYIELGEAPPSDYAETEIFVHLENGRLSTYKVSGDSFHFYNDPTEYTLDKVS